MARRNGTVKWVAVVLTAATILVVSVLGYASVKARAEANTDGLERLEKHLGIHASAVAATHRIVIENAKTLAVIQEKVEAMEKRLERE